MIDDRDAARLTAIYRRERLSFLQYVGQVRPYAGATDTAAREAVVAMAEEERLAGEAFGDRIDKLRVTLPHVGAFPTAFTNYNFTDVRTLLPLLVDAQERDLAALETDEAGLTVARAEVRSLVDLKRTHLERLRTL